MTGRAMIGGVESNIPVALAAGACGFGLYLFLLAKRCAGRMPAPPDIPCQHPLTFPAVRSLPIGPDSVHICAMSSSTKKPSGFGEMPQAVYAAEPTMVRDRLGARAGGSGRERGAQGRNARYPLQGRLAPARIERQTRAETPVDPDDELRAAAIKKVTAARQRVKELPWHLHRGLLRSQDPPAAGLNPVAGLEISLEEAEALETSPVTATVEALSALIQSAILCTRTANLDAASPARPEKSEGNIPFDMGHGLQTLRRPAHRHRRPRLRTQLGRAHAVLLGVTGSGKTFTAAQVIQQTSAPCHPRAQQDARRPALWRDEVLLPQQCGRIFRLLLRLLPAEAYVPRTDTFIEKESSINEQIDRMRHSATRSLLERDDVIIVASVSCIYGIGSVETYTAMTFQMKIGDRSTSAPCSPISSPPNTSAATWIFTRGRSGAR